MVNLSDLVDGINCSIEWGEKNLDLEGDIDTDWAKWRNGLLERDGQWPMDRVMLRTSRPPGTPGRPPKPNQTNNRREIWEFTVLGKRNRQGHKYHESMETRFFRKGAPSRC
jgi:hypothetical protein